MKKTEKKKPCGHVPADPNADKTPCELCGVTISPDSRGLWRDVRLAVHERENPPSEEQLQARAGLIPSDPRDDASGDSEPRPIAVFNDRELNTVLHALRILQELRDPPAFANPGCVQSEDIDFGEPTSCDHFEEGSPLSNAEIDRLCERLQLPDAAQLDAAMRTTIDECARATRMHLTTIHKHTSEKQRRGPIGDVALGMQITLSKLETLRGRATVQTPEGYAPRAAVELQAAIQKFNRALEGDSGDAESDVACEMRNAALKLLRGISDLVKIAPDLDDDPELAARVKAADLTASIAKDEDYWWVGTTRVGRTDFCPTPAAAWKECAILLGLESGTVRSIDAMKES